MSQHSLLSRVFTVSLVDKSEFPESSSRSSRRIILNSDILKNAKLFAGDILAVSSAGKSSIAPLHFAIGVAWPSSELSADSIQLSISHLLSAGVHDGGKVEVTILTGSQSKKGLPSLKGMREARHVVLDESIDHTSENAKGINKPDWLCMYLHEVLVDYKYVYCGQKLRVTYESCERTFTVAHISSDMGSGGAIDIAEAFDSLTVGPMLVLWTAGWETQVVLKQPSKPSTKLAAATVETTGGMMASLSQHGYSSVGGLDKQISQIRDLIEIPLTRPDLFRHFGLKPPRGILLHGPPGTGKTHLARAVVASTRSSVLIVNGSELSSMYHGETEARLRDIFADARRRSPCIVVLDEVDALCPRREDGAGGEVEKRVVATLLTIMDGMGDEGGKVEGDERVVVIATTNRPNAIDPALRRPGRFDREIEIGIPDANARYEILSVILAKTPHDIADAGLRSVAARTHGYVGADLSAVIREAGTVAIKRWMSSSTHLPDNLRQSEPRSQQLPTLTLADLTTGLTAVQPSAMREVYLETPAVRWADIGGQARVQQKLRECVEWPLRYPEAFDRLGVRPPKGVLLYGPPGCSKTLTAKALATESGLNFIAVKGPELLNKFVGESERAVREIFRKARAASPSIIFFDEIDALGTSRDGDGSETRNEGVLTTLLNEMDGMQELVGVTVVAATNRPDVIDSALMRPGRLDRILYVGPPDLQGRIDILRIRTQKMETGPDVDLEELANLTEGCSGAELAALCQDAALLVMKENITAPFVPRAAFLEASKTVRRQITPAVIQKFELWKDRSGLTSA